VGAGGGWSVVVYGVGVDLVDIGRIERVFERFGERFAGRILTAHEMSAWRASRFAAPFLAKRFAVKEAFFKALGTGLRRGMSWHDVEVRHDPLGKPRLVIGGYCAELMNARGALECHASITDERRYALAFVVLSGGAADG